MKTFPPEETNVHSIYTNVHVFSHTIPKLRTILMSINAHYHVNEQTNVVGPYNNNKKKKSTDTCRRGNLKNLY